MATLAGMIAIVAVAALPSSASAASCPVTPGVFATAWIGGSGSLHNDANWTNGTPSGSCDVSITAAGDYTVSMTGGANAKSLTLGGTGSTPHLVISDESPNTNFDAQPAGITIAAGASVTLTCQVGGCPGGGPDIYSGPSPFANAGVITVDANTGGGAVVGGQITNTGTLSFAKTASLSGKVTNQGSLLIADGAVVTNTGSSCGDTGALVKNDTGGLIDGESTGLLSVRNFEQGAGTTRDVTIPCGGTLSYTGAGPSDIRATGGFNLTGEIQSGQSLTVSAESGNTNATLQSNFTNKGSIALTCPPSPGECSGGAAGGAGFNVNDKDFVNAGVFTVAAASGAGASVGANSEGTIVNTGTMQFDQSAGLGGPVTNKGKINIADTKVVSNNGSSCGDTGASVKNDTGGSINAVGSGTLSLRHYEQGAGTTSGTTPVQLPCGSVKYTGSGASKVLATGGFNLTGEMQAGQELTVSGESSNTNVTLQGNFTSKGSITLTCRQGSCGGVGFNVNDKDFVNAGTFTIAAAAIEGSGVGANFEGTIVNTGEMNFDQTADLGGPVTNKGEINIANEKIARSNGSSCGDTGASVKNDTGGSINAVGSGYLRVFYYEQGAGTTSGSLPVRIPCGALKYSGAGTGTVLVEGGGTPMTGNVAAGQTLRLVGGINSGPFTNAGTIVFDQSGSNPNVNAGTVTNTGKIELVGPSANTSSVTGGQLQQTGAAAEIVVPAGTKLNPGASVKLEAGALRGAGTIAGSVENTGGVVKPGDSPGTLTLSGSYVQGADGRLEIEVAGTGVGFHDVLALGGAASLDGTLALVPLDGYADSSAIGDSVSFLTYGGSVVDGFAETTVAPPLSCPKAFAVSNDSGAKALKATVVDSGAVCPNNNPPQPPAPPTPPVSPPSSAPAPVPNTKLGARPGAKVKTGKSKTSVRFSFSADVPGATFQCKLDKGAYKACTSPKSYKVKPGKHTFSVRAVGPGGADPTPATFKFKVVKDKG